jgi:hypothetical protein
MEQHHVSESQLGVKKYIYSRRRLIPEWWVGINPFLPNFEHFPILENRTKKTNRKKKQPTLKKKYRV